MRVYGLFRAAWVRFCIALSFTAITVISVSANHDAVGGLPDNARPVLPDETTVSTLLNAIDPNQLTKHVETLQNMYTRHVNSGSYAPDQGIEAAARYIASEFDAIRIQTGNLVVSTQPFSVYWGGKNPQLQNIIAVIPGTEIEAGAIVIGAHYDSICSDPMDAYGHAPGANDNASGVAALIELARVLSARRHRVTIIFVAFSGEEIGLAGSKAFVRDYIQALNLPVSMMINLDMIGGSTGNDGKIRLFSAGPEDSPSRRLARAIHLIGYHHAPGMEIVVQDRVDRWGRWGDHIPFSDAGYPAVRFIEEQENHNHQHNGFDTIDRIQIPYLRRAAQTVLVVVTALADGPAAPAQVTLTHNGNGNPTLEWTMVPEAQSYVIALRSHNSLAYDHYFEVTGTSVDWSGFDPSQFAAVAIAVKGPDGLLGPLSAEYPLN